MIKTIILEDEEPCVALLEGMLRQNFRQVQVLAVSKTLAEAQLAIETHRPDLVFSDIHLGNESAFDLFHRLGSIDFEIIFTTAFERYALQAIKCSALDYLLKPFSRNDLSDALFNYQQRQHKKTAAEQFEVLFHNLKRMQKDARQIALPTANGLQVVTLNTIIRCQAEANYTTFYLADKSRLVVSRTLKEYDDLLSVYDFVRVHSAHLINLHHVKHYVRGEGGSLVMEDGSEVMVSRRKKEELLKRLAEI